MIAIPALAMMLIFGAPTFAAMTPALWAMFALGQVGNIRSAIKLEKKLYVLAKDPNFQRAIRQNAAANGEAAIKWQQRQMEF